MTAAHAFERQLDDLIRELDGAYDILRDTPPNLRGFRRSHHSRSRHHPRRAWTIGRLSSRVAEGAMTAAAPDCLAQLRRLMADNVSLDCAWQELSRNRPAPQAMVDALVFSLRRGVNELTKPDVLRRLSALDQNQLKEVCRRVQNFKPEIAPPWSAEEVARLIVA
jgi:hypothetical protein